MKNNIKNKLETVNDTLSTRSKILVGVSTVTTTAMIASIIADKNENKKFKNAMNGLDNDPIDVDYEDVEEVDVVDPIS